MIDELKIELTPLYGHDYVSPGLKTLLQGHILALLKARCFTVVNCCKQFGLLLKLYIDKLISKEQCK